MRLLVDAQLPPALARWLVEQGHVADHVFDLNMTGATDREIWAEAKRRSAVIVSKDEDFVSLSNLASDPVQVLWLRIGNTTRRALLERLGPVFPAIEKALTRGELLVEVG